MAAPTMLTASRTWKISHREHNRQMHAAHGNTAPRHNVAGALRRYNAAGSHGAPPPDGEQRHQQRQTPRQRPRRPRHHHHADEGAGEHPPLVIATSATWAARLRRQAAANGAAPRQGQVPRPRRQPRARRHAQQRAQHPTPQRAQAQAQAPAQSQAQLQTQNQAQHQAQQHAHLWHMHQMQMQQMQAQQAQHMQLLQMQMTQRQLEQMQQMQRMHEEAESREQQHQQQRHREEWQHLRILELARGAAQGAVADPSTPAGSAPVAVGVELVAATTPAADDAHLHHHHDDDERFYDRHGEAIEACEETRDLQRSRAAIFGEHRQLTTATPPTDGAIDLDDGDDEPQAPQHVHVQVDVTELGAAADLQSTVQDALDLIIRYTSRSCDSLDRALAHEAVADERRHTRRRLRCDTYKWLVRVGDLCHGLHESVTHELRRRRKRHLTLPAGVTCTHYFYLLMETVHDRDEEARGVPVDILRASLTYSLEDSRRFAELERHAEAERLQNVHRADLRNMEYEMLSSIFHPHTQGCIDCNDAYGASFVGLLVEALDSGSSMVFVRAIADSPLSDVFVGDPN
eukprot:scaffold44591_cov65-Phaeocystis_antarctica.AAC.1